VNLMATNPLGRPRITRDDMEKIAGLVYANSGIALRPELKEAMVVARLQRRLRNCGFETFTDYLEHVEGDQSGGELRLLVDALTTNHTGFMREPQHFEYLASVVVPPLLASSAARPILAWSAACATGEEPYTMAVTLLECIPAAQHDRIRILASDLATHALDTARAGVYPIDRVSEVPQELLRRYFERGMGEQSGLARVKRPVRTLVDFRRLNLMAIESLGHTFDFIFCRNVMFYFDRPARQRVVTMLERHLVPGGYLFVSHSESLSEVQHDLRRCVPGVYQRGDA
jgi:chemotaxis protein methyltransferase CheR